MYMNWVCVAREEDGKSEQNFVFMRVCISNFNEAIKIHHTKIESKIRAYLYLYVV